MMLTRWNKLKQRIQAMIDPSLDCAVEFSQTVIPGGDKEGVRFTIKVNGKMIWDFPRQFPEMLDDPEWPKQGELVEEVVERWLAATNAALMQLNVYLDRWGLIDVLLGCDKRMDKRRLQVLAKRTHSYRVKDIIAWRLSHQPDLADE